ncbi:hypothetical protein GX441_09265 [bacterium]|nr:hypothetical protein [bacterium]
MSNGRRFSWLGVVVGITIATPVIVVLLTAIYLLSDYYGFSILHWMILTTGSNIS